ncbi:MULTISPECIES: hypothetical protein [unclassified Treponema]|uniref:hypothetical protein n=1 Tax=unclassified Treponema TaxID=2638727 RepID=UPI000530146B|nr:MULTISPECIES: hypothetical protein [unclassified Treponema]AIW89084.1 hypothetical protein JO41_04060 [Treponema sp. OMZ 838]UTC44643.1 hypothetical protein E4N66_11490 [Treponema sp. OMZ 857]
MNQDMAILCVIGALLLIMMISWIINLVRAAKNKQPLRWLGRIVYISGILCIGLNAIRSWRIYENSAGIIIAAHAIALFSILSALIRSERQHNEQSKP